MDVSVREACEAFWGNDWIAPLSDVLGVDRRTVQRWKSGDVQMPDRIAAELVKLPRLGSATRAYGEMLRRLSAGETIEDIDQGVADQKRASGRVRADIGKYTVITVLATVQLSKKE